MTEPTARGMIRAAGFYYCSNIPALELGSVAKRARLKATLDGAVTKAGYTLIPGSDIYPYSDPPVPAHGFSYRAHIGESGLDIHTWPEKASLQFSAHTCSEEERCNRSFWKFCEFLKQHFGAEQVLDCGHIYVPVEPASSIVRPIVPPLSGERRASRR